MTAHADPPSPDGSVRIDALVRDVSERKKLEDQTRDLYHQLLQAEKLAALGQTISGVAHELNNPLATILTWAERLSQRPPSEIDEKTKRGLETILSESERAAKIVRNLLTFARKRQSTRAMVDLNHVVRETLALRSYEQRITNITIVDALASGLPQVFADAHQVQQVLLNLIINAEQAMLTANGRGTLVVRSWHDVERESIVLEINDDGPGIAEELQPKIFDPFFTTKEVGKGTGLGLTVAYAIVQEHGGRIRLASNAGIGRVVLCRASGQRHAAAAAATAARRQSDFDALAGSTVLVVEDEPALAAAVSEALTDAGFVVDRAGDGEEALRRVGAKSYDLIVCDLKMPKIDGMRFYQKLVRDAPRRGAPRHFRHRRRGRHRRRDVSAGQRLPLARQAVQARRSPAHRARHSRLKKRKAVNIRDGPLADRLPTIDCDLSRRRHRHTRRARGDMRGATYRFARARA